MGSQNFEIGSRDPGDAHLAGDFVVRMQEVRLPSLYQI